MFKKARLILVNKSDRFLGNNLGDIVEVKQYIPRNELWYVDKNGKIYSVVQLEFLE